MTNAQPSLRELVGRIRDAGRRCTLLGVGPVSEVVVRATFEVCRRHACPAVFIASRNQVDLESLGHGYLMGGMDQRAFVGMLKAAQAAAGYEGPVYICRDHGGPWQRNVELDEKYPVERAMAIAGESFRGDIEAGFNYIHIDPTKCPHPFTMDDLCRWTVELLAFCEEVRSALGRRPIDYEVGTEDIKGGLTDTRTSEAFLAKLTAMLQDASLPLPTCVVGQTGTLTRLDRNVGCFDVELTRKLVAVAARYGIGFKEHNGDYLDEEACRVHPEIGVTGMNVAPEFGLVETDACLALADMEEELVRDGGLDEIRASGFRKLLLEQTFRNSPWQKWMTDEVKQLADSRVEADESLRLLIGRVCGHYVYNEPQIRSARRALYENVDRFHPTEGAEQLVIERVGSAVESYVGHFCLSGVNDLWRAK